MMMPVYQQPVMMGQPMMMAPQPMMQQQQFQQQQPQIVINNNNDDDGDCPQCKKGVMIAEKTCTCKTCFLASCVLASSSVTAPGEPRGSAFLAVTTSPSASEPIKAIACQLSGRP